MILLKSVYTMSSLYNYVQQVWAVYLQQKNVLEIKMYTNTAAMLLCGSYPQIILTD